MNNPELRASNIWKDLLFLVQIAVASLVVALLLNYFRESPLPLVHASKQERIDRAAAKLAEKSAASSPAAGLVLEGHLDLETFREFVDQKQGLVLDARPEVFHRLGHVPGAVSLPRNDFEARYSALKASLEGNKSQPLVVYCASPTCEDAELLARGLAALGYSNVAIFTGGWEEWTAAGLPEETHEPNP